MNIELFNKTYWCRRFGELRNVKGYMTATYSDFTADLNVRPSGSDNLQAQPEGERIVERLSASGSDVLLSADHDTGVKGDLLWYHGKWYECVSAVEWDHTILSHWEYQFVDVPHDAGRAMDLTPPSGDPESYYGGDDG